MSKPKKFQIVTHNDLDGGVSAICVVNYLKQKYSNIEYGTWFGTYKKIDAYVERLMDWPEKFEEVFITDIHVHPNLAMQFPKNFHLYDHHDSAKELNTFPQCKVDTSGKLCGAAMCYKYLLKDNNLKFDHLTKLVAIANDYDLWHLKLPNNIAKNLNFIYYYYWGDDFIKRFMNGFDGFNEKEKDFLKNKWKEIQEQIDTSDYIDLMSGSNKNKFCLVTIKNENTGETNELCEHILNKMGYSVAMCIIPSKRKLSTRIRTDAVSKGFHIGNLHSELGIGGGHAAAGGGNYEDEQHLEKICESVAQKIIDLQI